MTSEGARRLICQAERLNLPVLAVYAQPNRIRDYSLVIEPVERDRQIFVDAMKAHIALAKWLGKGVRENLRYLTPDEEGIPTECNAEN